MSIPYIVPYAEYWDTRMSKKNGNVNKLLQCTMQLVLAQHEFELKFTLNMDVFLDSTNSIFNPQLRYHICVDMSVCIVLCILYKGLENLRVPYFSDPYSHRCMD